MRRYPFGTACLIFAIFFIVGSVIARGTINRCPTITVMEINTSPTNFFDSHPEIMLPMESKIYEAYRAKKNTKWTDKYVYAYVFKKHNKWFSRVDYLESHKSDAVDREVIFSNQLPDQKSFIISPK